MEDAFSNSAIGSVQGGLMWAFPPDPGGESPAPAAEYRKIYRLRRLTDPRPEVHEPGPSVFYIPKKNFDEIHSYLSTKMKTSKLTTDKITLEYLRDNPIWEPMKGKDEVHLSCCL